MGIFISLTVNAKERKEIKEEERAHLPDQIESKESEYETQSKENETQSKE